MFDPSEAWPRGLGLSFWEELGASGLGTAW